MIGKERGSYNARLGKGKRIIIGVQTFFHNNIFLRIGGFRKLVVKKRGAVIQDKKGIASLRLHFGEPLHGNNGHLLQIGGNGIHIVFKGIVLISVKSAL